jgi:hypothetical protein
MSSSTPQKPGKPAAKDPATAVPNASPRAEGGDRLAAALRDNLKRRKAQARARQERAPAGPHGDPRRP